MEGHIWNDNAVGVQEQVIFAVKNFGSELPFLVTSFGCCKEVTGLKGFKTKTITDDGAQRAFLS
jgi:hypothetical protein